MRIVSVYSASVSDYRASIQKGTGLAVRIGMENSAIACSRHPRFVDLVNCPGNNITCKRGFTQMTWTDGYISDVCFPAFFYKEMQPAWLSTVATFQGFSAPDIAQPFTLCELGCGVGINVLVAAACHPDAHFVGVDFNPEHLRAGRDAATAAGIRNLEFIQADFAEFARSNHQPFDFITSHGVWSWIAPTYQDALLDCVSSSLKPGGILYLHYMCHPGSTDLQQLQHLLNLCAHHMPGASPRKAQIGLKLLQQMADGGAFAGHPAMLRHLANMAKRDPADLAHEFLTDHWQPQHSVDVHQQVAEKNLTFLSSADVFNNLDVALSIPGKLQALVGQTRLPALAESLKDMARNTHHRMDLFQKAPAKLDHAAAAARFKETRFHALPDAPQQGPITFSTPIGPITGPANLLTPLLNRLASGPATGAQLLQLPAFPAANGPLLQSLQLLMMEGIVHPSISEPSTANGVADALSGWFQKNGIALSIAKECGTAVRAPIPG